MTGNAPTASTPFTKRDGLFIILLTGIAYALRTVGAHSSVAYFVDTQIVREAFQIGEALTSGGISVIEGFKYPLTLPAYLLVIYGVFFFVNMALGTIQSVGEFATLALSQRETMHLIAVYTLGVINAAIVPVSVILSRTLNKAHRGWLAGGLVTFNLLLVQFGNQPRPHVPLATLWILTVLLLLLMKERPSSKLMLAGTLLAAFTVGTLQNGIVILVPYAIAWIITVYRARQQTEHPTRLILEVVGNLILLFGMMLILYPGFLSEYSRFFTALITGQGRYVLGGGKHNFQAASFTLAAVPLNVRRLWHYQPFLTAGFVIAFPFFVWRLRDRIETLAIFLPFPLIIMLVFGLYQQSFPRILAVLNPFFVIVVSYALEELVTALSRTGSIRRSFVETAAWLVVCVPLAATAVRLVYVMAQPDTRTLASRWVEVNVPEGTGLMANFYPHDLTRTLDSIRQQQSDYPDSLATVDEWRMQSEPASQPSDPAYAVVLSEVYQLEDKVAYEVLIDALEIKYAMIETHQANGFDSPSAFTAFLDDYGTVRQVFCPGPDVHFTYLPDDIQGVPAWRVIWNTQHPGPIVLIFQVDGDALCPTGSLCSTPVNP